MYAPKTKIHSFHSWRQVQHTKTNKQSRKQAWRNQVAKCSVLKGTWAVTFGPKLSGNQPCFWRKTDKDPGPWCATRCDKATKGLEARNDAASRPDWTTMVVSHGWWSMGNWFNQLRGWCKLCGALQKIEVYLQGLDILEFLLSKTTTSATQPPESWKGTLQVKLIWGFSRNSTKHGGTAVFPGKGSAMANKRVGLGWRSPGCLDREPKTRPTTCSSCVVGTLETMAKVDCSANILLKSSWLKRAKRSNSWGKGGLGWGLVDWGKKMTSVQLILAKKNVS